MPNFPPHAYVQMSGTIDLRTTGDQADIWSSGMRILGNTGAGGSGFLANEETYLDYAVPRLKAWFVNALSLIRSDAKLDTIKINNILPNGHYQDGVTHQRTFAPVAGAASTNADPAFCSVAWSWKTAVNRGLAAKGRNYLPNSFAWAAGSSITTASRAAHLVAAQTFLIAMSGTLPESEGAVVAIVSGVRTGAVNQINGIRVGDLLDVQERRRNATAESYVTAAFP
jgi:hypothetical protein